MLEIRGDIWQARNALDWVCLTTNGTLRKDGALVMGRGIAREARDSVKGIDKLAGYLVKTHGLKVFPIISDRLILFPVKYEFYQPASLQLIFQSTIQLVDLLPSLEGGRVLIGRPGCGNGKLDWVQVRPILLTYFAANDRLVVFHK